MATYVKLRGLQRVNNSATGSILSARGPRVRSGYGLQYPGGVKATATGGAGTSALTVTAKYGGTWANGHTVNVSQAGSGTGTVTVSYAAGTAVPTFTVTGGAGMTAANAAAALNANALFGQLYTASYGSTGAGTTLVSPGALATGTNVGTGQTIEVVLNGGSTVIVDVDDAFTLRQLRRNAGQFLSLGQV